MMKPLTVCLLMTLWGCPMLWGCAGELPEPRATLELAPNSAATAPLPSGEAARPATSGDVEAALKKAGLFNQADTVSPLLDTAGITSGTQVKVSILVGADSAPDFQVSLTPPDPQTANNLTGLLRARFSSSMKKAILDAGLNVTEPVKVIWLSF